jgi:hypothetical protein
LTILGPFTPEVQRRIDEAPNDQTRQLYLEMAINNQWQELMTPPPPHLDMAQYNPPLQPDIRQRFAHLPPHLQTYMGRLPIELQHRFSISPPDIQYRYLYTIFTGMRNHMEQMLADNRRQFDLDPLLTNLPDLRNWLYNTRIPSQFEWLHSTFEERLSILRDHGMLAWMEQMHAVHYQREQERFAAQQPERVPDHLLNAEDLARYGNGFRDYMPWYHSAERRAWIEELRRTGQL